VAPVFKIAQLIPIFNNPKPNTMKYLFTLCLFVVAAVSVQGQCSKAYYDFSGNAQDISGNGHHGTANGPTLTTDKDANANSAYSFDGTDDEIIVSDHADLRITSELTLAAWVYLDQNFSSEGTIIEKGSTNEGWEWSIRVRASQEIYFSVHDTDGISGYFVIESNQILSKQTWYHIAGVFKDNNFATLYIDGVPDTTTTNFNAAMPYGPGTATMTIGIRRGWTVQDPAFPFNGKIDEVGIYDCALDSTQIDSLMNPVGINEMVNTNAFDIYPNPTTGIFTVQGTVSTVQVYDLLGNLVFHTNKRQVDMSSYPAGIYMVRVGEVVSKIVLQ